jgi:heme-degrading monooxygenase HmoA
MFIHSVLFEIKPQEVITYRNDSKMWAQHAKKAKGFVAYHTMKRHGYKDQYASVYEWDTKQNHDRFMKKFHDWLVSKSKAKVKVLGYYNLKAIDRLRKS